MLCQIENGSLRVCADTRGAQLASIRSAGGTEYLWQGDAAYWKNRAPNIFPYVARLTGGRYTYRGESYAMPRHGFAPGSEFTPECGEGVMTMRLDSDERTYEMYPFRFAYFITYRLDGDTLYIENRVENRDEKTMYFGLGGHPGINVPLDAGLGFEDYFLEFAPCSPRQVLFTPDCFVSGQEPLFALENGRMHLRHELFDNDAVVLRGWAGPVTLRSERGAHGVTLDAPGFPLLGFWHAVKTDAPYVCFEPWTSLPSRSGVVEDFETQPDLVALPAGETYRNEWSLKFF